MIFQSKFPLSPLLSKVKGQKLTFSRWTKPSFLGRMLPWSLFQQLVAVIIHARLRSLLNKPLSKLSPPFSSWWKLTPAKIPRKENPLFPRKSASAKVKKASTQTKLGCRFFFEILFPTSWFFTYSGTFLRALKVKHRFFPVHKSDRTHRTVRG